MSTRWLFKQSGEPAYYETGNNVFSRDGHHAFWISNGWWYRAPDGKASYYVQGVWVFEPDGKPAFYYGDG